MTLTLDGVDLSADVGAPPGGTSLKWGRGANFDGSSESPGYCSISVRNDGKKYNPSNGGSSIAANLKLGKKVHVSAVYSATTYHLFDGYLRRVVPDAAAGFASLECQDALYRYGRFETSVAYTARSINAFRLAILTDIGESASAALATGSGPEASTTLTGADQANALSLLDDLNQATGTVHFIDPVAGGYTYTSIDRTTLEAAASAETFTDTDFSVPFPETLGGWDYTDEGIVNSARAAATPRVIGDVSEVWSQQGTLTVDASTTMTLWADFNDPVSSATIAYTATNAPTVTLTPFSRSAKITIAAGASGSTVTSLVISGRLATVPTNVISELSEDTASITTYGQFIGSEVRSEWLSNRAAAKGLADYTIWRYKDPRAKPSMTVVNRFPSQLQREVADILTLTASAVSISGVRYYIRSFETAISGSGARWDTTYQLEEAPAALGLFTVGGSAAQGVGGGSQILGY